MLTVLLYILIALVLVIYLAIGLVMFITTCGLGMSKGVKVPLWVPLLFIFAWPVLLFSGEK